MAHPTPAALAPRSKLHQLPHRAVAAAAERRRVVRIAAARGGAACCPSSPDASLNATGAAAARRRVLLRSSPLADGVEAGLAADGEPSAGAGISVICSSSRACKSVRLKGRHTRVASCDKQACQAALSCISQPGNETSCSRQCSVAGNALVQSEDSDAQQYKGAYLVEQAAKRSCVVTRLAPAHTCDGTGQQLPGSACSTSAGNNQGAESTRLRSCPSPR
jgi:hypothetical protein